MWCRHCQQQTPALGPPGSVGPRCGRCHRTSPAAQADPNQSEPEAGGLADNADDARRAIYRSLRSAHATISAGESSRTLRYDVGQSPLAEAMSEPHRQPEAAAAKPVATPLLRPVPIQATAASARAQATSWMLASIGAVGLGTGIGLGGWSLLGGRPELWNPALAAAIGGQGLLIIGLLQLLASLWNAARQGSAKLSLMHDELRRLRRTTDEQAGRHQSSAAGFYADLAREAPPEMMLGNLRGQLDRLASRLRG